MLFLMPPETGKFFESAAQLPVSGGIRMSLFMPPETGNYELHPATGPKNPEVVSKARSKLGSTVYAVWKSPTSSRASQSESVHSLLLAVI